MRVVSNIKIQLVWQASGTALKIDYIIMLKELIKQDLNVGSSWWGKPNAVFSWNIDENQ